MRKKLLSMLLAGSMLLTLSLTGCGTKQDTKDQGQVPTQAAAKLKVGFIYVGPIGDGGWTFAHNEGRKALETALGDKVETTYKEAVSDQNADSEQVMKDMIDQGCKVIFGTSFGYQDHMEKLAKEYPDVKFIHCSGSKSGANFTNYFGQIEQPRYLSGIAAAMKSKSNKIGYVAAMDIPECIRGINAFTLGAQSIKPNIKVVVRWTGTWYDPAKEKDAAKALLDEGCDVIAQHQDTTGPQIAAEEKGAFAIGYNTDSRNASPKAYITAPIWDWGPYYINTVKAVMNNTWKPESFWGDIKEGTVKLAPLTANAAEGTQAKIDEAQKKMMDGTLNVFAGPIKDQTGKVVVEAGKTMTKDEQYGCMWFVQGVEGTISKK